MDFLNLAKQGYSAYEASQSHGNVSRTGGEEYNSPDNSHPNRHSGGPNIDNDEAARTAAKHGSGDPDLFSNAMSFASGNEHEHNEPVDEEHVTRAHQQAYQEGNAGSLSAHSMGGAAAMKVLQQFTSGGGSGGGSQTQLISMAMAEASKLFDQSGGAASGNKQDAVNGAAMTVMKLLVQSKFSGAIGGGNSGGLGGLMGLAGKFL